MFETLEKKLAAATVGALCWWSGIASAVNDLPGGPAVHQLNLPPAVTKIAEEQHALHWMMMFICLGIFIVVFGVMFYSIFKHRKSVGHQPASFHESIKVELAWTIVPFIIVIVMAIPATRTVIAQKDTSNAELTIKATGYQWRWGYEYLSGEGSGINFVSSLDNGHRLISDSGAKGVAIDDYLLKVDHPLVVPVNKKIRIVTTANDVIHAWGVPAFSVKQDAIPGVEQRVWFTPTRTGEFEIACSQLCGLGHYRMRGFYTIQTQADFDAWLAQQPAGP